MPHLQLWKQWMESSRWIGSNGYVQQHFRFYFPNLNEFSMHRFKIKHVCAHVLTNIWQIIKCHSDWHHQGTAIVGVLNAKHMDSRAFLSGNSIFVAKNFAAKENISNKLHSINAFITFTNPYNALWWMSGKCSRFRNYCDASYMVAVNKWKQQEIKSLNT